MKLYQDKLWALFCLIIFGFPLLTLIVDSILSGRVALLIFGVTFGSLFFYWFFSLILKPTVIADGDTILVKNVLSRGYTEARISESILIVDLDSILIRRTDEQDMLVNLGYLTKRRRLQDVAKLSELMPFLFLYLLLMSIFMDGAPNNLVKGIYFILVCVLLEMVFFRSRKPIVSIEGNHISFITMPRIYKKVKDLTEYELGLYPEKIELRTFRKKIVIKKSYIGDAKFKEIGEVFEKLPFDSTVRYKMPNPNAQS